MVKSPEQILRAARASLEEALYDYNDVPDSTTRSGVKDARDILNIWLKETKGKLDDD